MSGRSEPHVTEDREARVIRADRVPEPAGGSTRGPRLTVVPLRHFLLGCLVAHDCCLVYPGPVRTEKASMKRPACQRALLSC